MQGAICKLSNSKEKDECCPVLEARHMLLLTGIVRLHVRRLNPTPLVVAMYNVSLAAFTLIISWVTCSNERNSRLRMIVLEYCQICTAKDRIALAYAPYIHVRSALQTNNHAKLLRSKAPVHHSHHRLPLPLTHPQLFQPALSTMPVPSLNLALNTQFAFVNDPSLKLTMNWDPLKWVRRVALHAAIKEIPVSKIYI
jgi:hypothetical protein